MGQVVAALRTFLNRRWIHWPLAAVLGAVLGYLVSVILFPAPLTPSHHVVDQVYGLPVDEAEKILAKQGFRIKVEPPEPDAIQPAGQVVWQQPVANTSLPAGGLVRLVASAGPPQVPIPDLIGFPTMEAIRLLGTTGFQTGSIDSIAAGAEAGIVVATRPGAGTGRTIGSPVDVVVSRGPATIRIPQLIGLTLEDARFQLESSGLRVGAIRPRTVGRGGKMIVREQRPAPGILIPQDGRVDLTVVPPPEGA